MAPKSAFLDFMKFMDMEAWFLAMEINNVEIDIFFDTPFSIDMSCA